MHVQLNEYHFHSAIIQIVKKITVYYSKNYSEIFSTGLAAILERLNKIAGSEVIFKFQLWRYSKLSEFVPSETSCHGFGSC